MPQTRRPGTEAQTRDEQAAAWVARLQATPVDPAVLAEFEAWYAAEPRNQGAFLRAEAAWMLLDRAQVMAHGQSAADTLVAHSAVAQRVHEGKHPSRRYVMTGAVAASLTGAVAVGLALKGRMSVATVRGELRKVPLKDRSVAAVNTDSQIDVDMSARLRHVQLVKGEVWFEVAKNPDVPFVVSAGDVRVRAVGTAFSVRRHDKGVDVLVTEGVVETWNVNDKTKRQTLTAGNEAFVPEKIADAMIDVAYRPQEVTRKLAWRDREIILHQESLSDAVAEFNRYNTREIIIADPRLNTAQLVGGFQVDQPESFALAVKVALDVPVDINDQRILIGTVGGHS